MPKLANRGVATVFRDRVPGLRQHHIDKLSELVRRGDPRLWHNFSKASESKRGRLEETSPVVRQAARQLDALVAGEPVTVPRPTKRQFPCVAEIDWLDDSDFEHRPPRLVVLYPDDTIEPA